MSAKQFALTPRGGKFPAIQDPPQKKGMDQKKIYGGEGLASPLTVYSGVQQTVETNQPRSSHSSQFSRGNPNKFIKRDIYVPDNNLQPKLLISTPESSRQNNTQGLPFFRGSTGESSSFSNDQILDRLEKLREKRGMRLRKIQTNQRGSIDHPQASLTSSKKARPNYVFHPHTTSTEDVVQAYESVADKRMARQFFNRRSKSRKLVADALKSQKNSSIDIQTLEKKNVDPYQQTNSTAKRQISPKTGINQQQRFMKSYRQNLESGSSINFDRSMNSNPDDQQQLPPVNTSKQPAIQSSTAVRNLRSYSSSNLKNSRTAINMKTMPSKETTTNPSPITQTEFQSIIEKYKAKALAESSSLVTQSINHELTLIPEQQELAQVDTNNSPIINKHIIVNDKKSPSPLRQTQYSNQQQQERIQRTKTREFLKSVMNSGQPYVEKNKYIVGEAYVKGPKNSNPKLKKSGTVTAPSQQISENNRRFKRAQLISASAGEQLQDDTAN